MTYLCDDCIYYHCIDGCEYPSSTVDPDDCPHYEGPECPAIMDEEDVWE